MNLVNFYREPGGMTFFQKRSATRLAKFLGMQIPNARLIRLQQGRCQLATGDTSATRQELIDLSVLAGCSALHTQMEGDQSMRLIALNAELDTITDGDAEIQCSVLTEIQDGLTTTKSHVSTPSNSAIVTCTWRVRTKP